MKNDQEVLVEVPQGDKFNCGSFFSMFSRTPGSTWNHQCKIVSPLLCAFYLKSHRFPDTAIFSGRGSASISLEFLEFVNTNPVWTSSSQFIPQADGQTKTSKAYCCTVFITRQSFNKCLLSIAYVQDTVATADFLLLSVLFHIMTRLVLLNS